MDASGDRDSTKQDDHLVKVARLLAGYNLHGFEEELERLWTANGSEQKSLCELATLFNERLAL